MAATIVLLCRSEDSQSSMHVAVTRHDYFMKMFDRSTQRPLQFQTSGENLVFSLSISYSDLEGDVTHGLTPWVLLAQQGGDPSMCCSSLLLKDG